MFKNNERFWLFVGRNLLLLNAFFLQSYLLRFKIGPYPSNVQEVLLGLTLLAFICDVFYRKKWGEVVKTLNSLKIVGIFLLLGVLSGLHYFFGDFQLLEYVRDMKFVVFGAIFVGLYFLVFPTDHERNQALRVMGYGALFFGIFSVFYNLGCALFDWKFCGEFFTDYRLSGPLDVPIYLAMYLTPFAIFFGISYEENRQKKMDLYLAATLFILILLTRSMMALAGGTLVFLLYLLKKFDIWKMAKVYWKQILLAGFVLVFFSGALFYSRLSSSVNAESSSFLERIEVWRTTNYLLQQGKIMVLGVGMGQFYPVYKENVVAALYGKEPMDYAILQPVNIFLLFWFQFGIVGIFLVLFAVIRLFLDLLYVDFKDFSYYQAVPFMLLYFFFHGAVDSPFFKNDLLILLLLLLELWRAKAWQDTVSKEAARKVTLNFVAFTSVLFFYLLGNAVIILKPNFLPYFINTKVLAREMLFYDVYEEHPHFAAIKYMTVYAKMSSYTDHTFRPDATMSRAEFVALALQAADYKYWERKAGNCFADVDAETAYSGAVCFAKELGFVSGDKNGEFRPWWRISKPEAFKILAQMRGWKIEARAFDDPDWWRPYIDYVREKGLLDYDWAHFESWHPITRGEFAEIWYREDFSNR